MAASILRAMLGTDCSRLLNWRWESTSRSISVSETTVADRGLRSSSASSPKWLPGPRVATFFPLVGHRGLPAHDQEELHARSGPLRPAPCPWGPGPRRGTRGSCGVGGRATREQPDRLEIEGLECGPWREATRSGSPVGARPIGSERTRNTGSRSQPSGAPVTTAAARRRASTSTLDVPVPDGASAVCLIGVACHRRRALVAGVNKNSQTPACRQHGVPVSP